MNRVVLFLFAFVFSTTLFSYAQLPVPPAPPVNEYYNEVFTVADCLNAYEGTTCIITGTISYDDSSYHHDRYIIQDNTGQISVRLSHHVIGNYKDVTFGSFKVIGELRGTNNHIDNHKPKKHHNDDPHIAARYIEKQ